MINIIFSTKQVLIRPVTIVVRILIHNPTLLRELFCIGVRQIMDQMFPKMLSTVVSGL